MKTARDQYALRMVATVLGEDALVDAERKRLATALDAGSRINVELADFLVRAVALAGGKCQRFAKFVQKSHGGTVFQASRNARSGTR